MGGEEEEEKKRKKERKKRHQRDGRNVTSLQSRSVFLTVNHRGLLPLRELHSTDETLVWRDPGGS